MKAIKCVEVKLPLHIHQTTKYPEPTFYREITALKDGKVQVVYIESIYWFEEDIFSQKQLKWLGDCKVKIKETIPEATISTSTPETNLITASGKTFNLKNFSNVWSKIKQRKLKKQKEENPIVLPKLIPLCNNGKPEYNLYTTLCRYAKRLHYEKLLEYEYLYQAATTYNKNIDEKLLPKKVSALAHKAYEYISQEIEKNPDKFKQRLSDKKLRNARIKNAAKLQARNKKTREQNIIKVKEAIATGKYHKVDGVSVNKSALSKATRLSRKTINNIFMFFENS